jgi:hypothetical protein
MVVWENLSFTGEGFDRGIHCPPVLFILVMEPLQCLLEQATRQMIISPLVLRTARFRTSFYADDTALFVKPIQDDISAIHQLLISCLATPLAIPQTWRSVWLYAVACEEIDLAHVLQDFGGVVGDFTCKYIWLPLVFRKPKRVEVQPLFDKAMGMLKGRKGKMMSFKH